MSNLSHKPTALELTTNIRIRRDLWEVARKEAYERRIPIQRVFDEILRAKLIKSQPADSAISELAAAAPANEARG